MARYPTLFQRGVRIILILSFMAMFLGIDTVHAATITVDTLIDENDHSCSDGDCSLRDAVESSVAGDTINFSVSGLITLSGTHLQIVNDLSITGPGPDNLTISGNDNSTIFTIAQDVEVSISGLTLTDGNYLYGGAISSSGELTIDNCVFSGNQSDFGGAIHSWFLATTTTINNSVINGNNTDFRGGGVYNRGDELIINNSTISGNQSLYLGGGVFNEWGTVTVENSTISGNTVNTGGGIANVEGTVTVTSSTISGNTANEGGGIHNSKGSIEIIQSTITNNTANNNGGGVYTRDTVSDIISLKNSIVFGNFDSTGTGAEDCYNSGGAIISLDYNLTGSGTGCSLMGSNDLTTSDAKLRYLGNYGGDTETHALYSDSPAMNKIPDGINDCGTLITVDQRGVRRPQSGFCDIGAFEYPHQTFTDVMPAYWAFLWIEAIAKAGITSGYPDGTYRPENQVTRAEMAVFLLKGMGVNAPAIDGSHPFSDISGHWAEAWIEELYDQGITGGYPDGTYRPENQVTRAEMAVFLLNGMGVSAPPIDGSHPFSDIAGHWAEIFIEELYDQGITSGYPDGTYRPENQVTRAEMAVFLVNTFNIPLQ